MPFSTRSHTLLDPEKREQARKLDIKYAIILSWSDEMSNTSYHLDQLFLDGVAVFGGKRNSTGSV